MDEKSREEAFSIIHDKALELLKFDLPKEVEEGLELIIALARYQHDIRTTAEIQKMEKPS